MKKTIRAFCFNCARRSMKPNAKLILLICLCVGSVQATWADSYTYVTIDVPGARVTNTLGINNAGQIVGFFYDSTGQHGFVETSGVFKTIDVPNSTDTIANSINDHGQIVGVFDFPGETSGPHGFVDRDGVFNTVDIAGNTATFASGINNSGEIVGSTVVFDPVTQNGTDYGFLDSDGVFTTINFPGTSGTTGANGINNARQIVGFFDDRAGRHGFVEKGSVFTSFDVPGMAATQPNGINNAGQIVGLSGSSSVFSPFVDSQGVFTFLEIPGVSVDNAYGINDAGQIVGIYSVYMGALGYQTHGFVATPVLPPASFASTRADIDYDLHLGLINEPGVGKSFVDNIGAAEKVNGCARLQILSAFLGELSAQVGQHITAPAAGTLQRDAQSLMLENQQACEASCKP